MAKPTKPKKALLFSSIIYSKDADLEKVIKRLTKDFGPIGFKSKELLFDWTDYYAGEMGEGLKRVFVAFSRLFERDKLAEIKLKTNSIEKSFSKGKARVANLDPGFLSLENMVLATCKNYSHRLYLRKGVFAEVTLIFRDSQYNTLEWTYPDYSSNEVLDIFNELREKYKDKLR